jgi:pimeloyl-ACP methyl ester carboxylesterase
MNPAPAPEMVSSPEEQLIRFGPHLRLVATLTRPRAKSDHPILLLMNAGVVSRAGPHRFNVKLARAFAANGFPALRVDLSGLGDSPAGFGASDVGSQWVADLQAAMDAAEFATGTDRFLLFGICLGAGVGLAAARVDNRIVGCALYDHYDFMFPTWRTRYIEVRTHLYQKGLRFILEGALRRVRRMSRRDALRKARGPFADATPKSVGRAELAEQLQGVLAHGTSVRFIFSGYVFDRYNYSGQFEDGFRRYKLTGRLEAELLPWVDHTITTLAAQRGLISYLLQWASSQHRDRESAAGT